MRDNANILVPINRDTPFEKSGIGLLLTIIILILLAWHNISYAEDSNVLCLECHGDESLTTKFQDGSTLSLYVDNAKFTSSAHGKKHQCMDCHKDVDLSSHPNKELKNYRQYSIEMVKTCKPCHADQSKDFAEGIHSKLLAKGIPKAAICSDCHNPHYMSKISQHRAEISATCSKCHEDVYKNYSKSVHGKAMSSQNSDVPVCTDCHNSHKIKDARKVSFHLDSTDTCSKCHINKEIMKKYGISTEVVNTYLSDFHGVSIRFYKRGLEDTGKIEATCIDCHGIHDIQETAGTNSIGIRENLIKVCQKCHPGATQNFSGAWLSHYIPGPKTAPLVYLVKLLYLIFIPFIIGGLLMHIIMDIVYTIQSAKIKDNSKHQADTVKGKSYIVRFTMAQRIKHAMVMTTFIILAVTGFCQKFYDTNWAEWIVDTLGGIDATRLIHRIMGIIFTILAIYHLIHDALNFVTGKNSGSIIPTWKDFTDVIHNIRHSFDRANPKPKFDRYDYKQKFEYWGMVLGSIVMIATGFILYFPILFTRFLPGQFVAASKVAHSNEAMLALLVVVIWHMYSIYLKHERIPIDLSIFTGKISIERMLEEHPLEYARLVDKEQ